jgi:hypothetical protein
MLALRVVPTRGLRRGLLAGLLLNPGVVERLPFPPDVVDAATLA